MPMAPAGPDPIGYAIVILGALATLYTIFFAIRAVLRPGELESDHPKRMILRKDR
jgi:hypothetical protein